MQTGCTDWLGSNSLCQLVIRCVETLLRRQQRMVSMLLDLVLKGIGSRTGVRFLVGAIIFGLILGACIPITTGIEAPKCPSCITFTKGPEVCGKTFRVEGGYSEGTELSDLGEGLDEYQYVSFSLYEKQGVSLGYRTEEVEPALSFYPPLGPGEYWEGDLQSDEVTASVYGIDRTERTFILESEVPQFIHSSPTSYEFTVWGKAPGKSEAEDLASNGVSSC